MPGVKVSEVEVAKAKEFLNGVWRGRIPELPILIWSLRGKESKWWTDTDKAAIDAVRLTESTDVYLGVGLAAKGTGRRKSIHERLTADEVVGIPGLWADVDYGGAGYLPDEKAAMEVIRAVAPPTIVVHSGHGLQPWWLLHQPWLFADETERFWGEQTALRWGELVRSRANPYRIDSVFDLSRIMRIPGTINHKRDPVAVRMISSDGPRYSLAEIEGLLSTIGAVETDNRLGCRVAGSGDIPDIPVGGPPGWFALFMALMANHDNFAASWNHRRRGVNWSISEYDQSLASIAAYAGWTDEEIVWLLYTHRDHHQTDGNKARERPKYTLDTLSRARAAVEKDENESTTVSKAFVADASDIDRIGDQLGGVDIKRIIKRGNVLPFYYLVQESGEEIPLGSNLFQSQVHIRQTVANHTKGVEGGPFLVQRYKAQQWDGLALSIVKVAIEVEYPDEGIVEFYDSLETYAADQVTYKEAEWEESLQGSRPFRREGRLFVNLPHFQGWLDARRERQPRAVLRNLMHSAGGNPSRETVGEGANRIQRRYWSFDLPLYPDD